MEREGGREGDAETVNLEQTGPMFQFGGVLFFFFFCLLAAYELLQRSNGEAQKKPFWVDKEENRWNANDKPPSALEDDQNLDTLQQSHNPLLQERSRRPIHTLPSAPRVCAIPPPLPLFSLLLN